MDFLIVLTTKAGDRFSINRSEYESYFRGANVFFLHVVRAFFRKLTKLMKFIIF